MGIPARFMKNKSNRPYLVAAFKITPLRRFQCLPGNPAEGLYRRIEDIAYQFTAYDPAVPKNVFSFNTGHTSGDDFLRLLHQSLPPLETWETLVGADSGAGLLWAPVV